MSENSMCSGFCWRCLHLDVEECKIEDLCCFCEHCISHCNCSTDTTPSPELLEVGAV